MILFYDCNTFESYPIVTPRKTHTKKRRVDKYKEEDLPNNIDHFDYIFEGKNSQFIIKEKYNSSSLQDINGHFNIQFTEKDVSELEKFLKLDPSLPNNVSSRLTNIIKQCWYTFRDAGVSILLKNIRWLSKPETHLQFLSKHYTMDYTKHQ